MANRWFITRDGKRRAGPFSDAQLGELASLGMLLPSDMLWLEDSTRWVPARSINGLFAHEPVATGLPEFRYAHLPLFRPDHRQVVFTVDRAGTLTGVSKTVRTSVSGGGGGGSGSTDSYGRGYGSSAPVWIDTTHETTMDLWILDADGRESSVRIKKDIPLKEGHRVTVVRACLDGRDTYPCLILNHTAGEMHFLKRSLAAVQLSPLEWLSVLAALVGLLVLCLLLGSVNGALGVWVGVTGAAFGSVLVLVRGALLKQRFARHCEDVAGLLP